MSTLTDKDGFPAVPANEVRFDPNNPFSVFNTFKKDVNRAAKKEYKNDKEIIRNKKKGFNGREVKSKPNNEPKFKNEYKKELENKPPIGSKKPFTCIYCGLKPPIGTFHDPIACFKSKIQHEISVSFSEYLKPVIDELRNTVKKVNEDLGDCLKMKEALKEQSDTLKEQSDTLKESLDKVNELRKELTSLIVIRKKVVKKMAGS